MSEKEPKIERRDILTSELPITPVIMSMVLGTVSFFSFILLVTGTFDRMLRVGTVLIWLGTGAISFFLGTATLRRMRSKTRRLAPRYIATAGIMFSLPAITWMIIMIIPAIYTAAKSMWWVISDFISRL